MPTRHTHNPAWNVASFNLMIPSIFGYGLVGPHINAEMFEAHVTFSLNASGMNKLKWVIEVNMIQNMPCSLSQWKMEQKRKLWRTYRIWITGDLINRRHFIHHNLCCTCTKRYFSPWSKIKRNQKLWQTAGFGETTTLKN